MTWTMRRLSAITRGRSGARSMSSSFLPPALRKLFRARSTRTATSAGSGLTGSVPVSMRATSSRLPIRSLMWSAWVTMMRRNWRISAGSRSDVASSMVVAEPLMEVSGVRSSWLTMPRNSARSRSISSRGVMSCMVTTTDSTPPSSDRMGVALSNTVTLRPPAVSITISSARTVSLVPSASAKGNSAREIWRPSARRTVTTSRSCSVVWSGFRRPSTILLASRLNDTGAPVPMAKTATPTGEVSIRVSRSALARRSSRCRRALATTSATCDANITRVSSSSRVNANPGRSFATWMVPTLTPRWRIGAAMKELIGTGSRKSERPISLMWAAKSGMRRGAGMELK